MSGWMNVFWMRLLNASAGPVTDGFVAAVVAGSTFLAWGIRLMKLVTDPYADTLQAMYIIGFVAIGVLLVRPFVRAFDDGSESMMQKIVRAIAGPVTDIILIIATAAIAWMAFGAHTTKPMGDLFLDPLKFIYISGFIAMGLLIISFLTRACFSLVRKKKDLPLDEEPEVKRTTGQRLVQTVFGPFIDSLAIVSYASITYLVFGFGLVLWEKLDQASPAPTIDPFPDPRTDCATDPIVSAVCGLVGPIKTSYILLLIGLGLLVLLLPIFTAVWDGRPGRQDPEFRWQNAGVWSMYIWEWPLLFFMRVLILAGAWAMLLVVLIVRIVGEEGTWWTTIFEASEVQTLLNTVFVIAGSAVTIAFGILAWQAFRKNKNVLDWNFTSAEVAKLGIAGRAAAISAAAEKLRAAELAAKQQESASLGDASSTSSFGNGSFGTESTTSASKTALNRVANALNSKSSFAENLANQMVNQN